jgi:hypothetical protein
MLMTLALALDGMIKTSGMAFPVTEQTTVMESVQRTVFSQRVHQPQQHQHHCQLQIINLFAQRVLIIADVTLASRYQGFHLTCASHPPFG